MLNGLALMPVHKDIEPNVNEVLTKFASTSKEAGPTVKNNFLHIYTVFY